MSKQEQLGRALDELRESVPDVAGAIVASFDGLPVATAMGDVEPSRVAAMTATVRALAVRVVETMGAGTFEEVVIRSGSGLFVVYEAGDLAALAVVARPDANLGLVHLEARRTAATIAELLAATRAEAEQAPVAEPAPVVEPAPVAADVPVYGHANGHSYEELRPTAPPSPAAPAWAPTTYEPARL